MAGSGFHLPLNKVDIANQPPLYFLWVQDGCILLTGTLWTIAYVLYIRQGLRDRSYGMPIVALYVALHQVVMPHIGLTDSVDAQTSAGS